MKYHELSEPGIADKPEEREGAAEAKSTIGICAHQTLQTLDRPGGKIILTAILVNRKEGGE
jgi:hypothetical protein